VNIANLFAAVDQFLLIETYFPCLLLVHPEIDRLALARQQILAHYAWPDISLGAVVSQALLMLPPQQRPRRVKRAVEQTLKPHRPGPVLCTDIDLLFEPSLSLDPLRLLREASRTLKLVVTWPGAFTQGSLTYAVQAHAHYQSWTQTDLCNACIINL
jgi:hypothetical protein